MAAGPEAALRARKAELDRLFAGLRFADPREPESHSVMQPRRP